MLPHIQTTLSRPHQKFLLSSSFKSVPTAQLSTLIYRNIKFQTFMTSGTSFQPEIPQHMFYIKLLVYFFHLRINFTFTKKRSSFIIFNLGGIDGTLWKLMMKKIAFVDRRKYHNHVMWDLKNILNMIWSKLRNFISSLSCFQY